MSIHLDPSRPDTVPPTMDPPRPAGRPRPSLLDIIFIIWAVVIPVGFGYRLLNSDGDLARHLRLGQLMLERHGLLETDIFSHTAAGRPFLAFEWLSEVVYAAVERVSGLAGVTVFAGLLLALSFTLLARFLLRNGADPFLAYATSMAAAVLTAGHWLARPHLFTMLAVVILLELLTRRDRSVWLYLPLFMVWANLHGGFLYGLLVIGAFLVGDTLQAWGRGDRAAAIASARNRAAALGAAVAGTLLNPHGIGLLLHVGTFFGRDTILRQTNEFQSPDFHTLNGKLFLAALLGGMAALALVRRRPPWPWLLLILGNTAIALISQRNIELFALTALPLIALHADSAWRRLPWLGRVRTVFAREYRGVYPGLGGAIVALLMVALALGRGRVAGVELTPNRFDPAAFPAEAVARGRAAGLSGPMFNDFIWGGYLLYAWPEQRVFIDGGTDHYGEELFGEYIRIWNLDPSWREALAKRGIKWVLVDPRTRLAHELVRQPEWSLWFCDSVSVLLERRSAPPASPIGETALGGCYASRGRESERAKP